MQIVAPFVPCPIVLVTGFLGSGKTTLLKNMLTFLQKQHKRVAVIQNEFAQTSIDGELLQDVQRDFILKELNTGSIFCACLFSQFKNVLVELSESKDVDMVIIEATGIADPIAVAQLLEDKRIAKHYFLSRIVAVVDAPRFEHVLSKITGVRHQLQVADNILVNKIDLVRKESLEDVLSHVKDVNPIAKIDTAEHAAFDMKRIFNDRSVSAAQSNPIKDGKLTKCGEGNYLSKSFKETCPITRENLNTFLSSLDEDILRLKGYITLEDGSCFVLQYVPGQTELKESTNRMKQTELISIGYAVPNFNLLKH